MESNTEHLIELYFANALSAAESAALKAQLAKDPRLAQQFAWRQSLVDAAQRSSLDPAMKGQLQELEKQYRFRRLLQRVLFGAIGLAILAAFIWYSAGKTHMQDNELNSLKALQDSLRQDSIRKTMAATGKPIAGVDIEESKTLDTLAVTAPKNISSPSGQPTKTIDQAKVKNAIAANFEHFDNRTDYATLAGVPDYKIQIMRAYALYDSARIEPAKYRKAVSAFQAIARAQPDSLTAEDHFYLGIALLGDHQFAAASKALQPIAYGKSDLSKSAKYYLGLAQAGAGNYTAARQSLSDYLSTPGKLRYREKAQKMIETLR